MVPAIRPSLPIRLRFAALISALLFVTVLVFGGAAQWEQRRVALLSATERLRSVSRETAQLLQTSAAALRGQMAVASQRPMVREALRSPTGDSARVLRRGMGSSAVVAGTQLWDSTGLLVLDLGGHSPALTVDETRDLVRLVADSAAATGPLRSVADSAAYPTIGRVTESGRHLGFLVQWRHLTASEQSRKQLMGLIGSSALVYVGNARGDLWTDLIRPVTDLPPRVGPDTGLREYGRREGGMRLAAGTPIAGTPWLLRIEFPRSEILARLSLTMARLTLAALVLLAIGALSALAMSATVTRPIAELVDATTAVRGGDYSRRVTVRRGDELGSLGNAFNDMAAGLAASRDRSAADAKELERRAEAAEQARAELDAALGSAPMGFAFHDLSLKYVRVNERLAEFNGLAAAEHVGLHVHEVAPALAPYIEEQLEHVIATGKSVLNVHVTGATPAHPDSVRHWLVSCFPVRTPDGRLLGVGSLRLDMTGQKELERQYQHAQKMEAVGRLAGGLAHDFNNILTAIFSFSEFALGDLPPSSPARDDIEQVKLAATRATTLNKKLLAFSRQSVLQPRVIDLNIVVTELEPMLRSLLREDITVHCVLAEASSTIVADRGQIEQVLVNLAVNAADAMPNGGLLVIETSIATLDEAYVEHGHPGAAVGEHVVLSVSDTGVGMDRETQARVFEPFFTTKESGKGTGLGLAMVYGVVKQSGGSIWLYSEPGEGTRFKIYLPRHLGPAPETSGEHTAIQMPRGSAVILLVEDEKGVRLASRRVLQQMGHTVLEAEDGKAALAKLNGGPAIDLVITDLIMPRMGGRELIEQLHAAGRTPKVLFMSGYTIDAATQRSLLEPTDAFIEKPFTPAKLASKVHEVLTS